MLHYDVKARDHFHQHTKTQRFYRPDDIPTLNSIKALKAKGHLQFKK